MWSENLSDDQAEYEALRRNNALEELNYLHTISKNVRGREAKIDLPFPIYSGKNIYTRLVVKSGVKDDFIDEWAEPLLSFEARKRFEDETLDKDDIKSLISKIKIETSDDGGVLLDGKHYKSEVNFAT